MKIFSITCFLFCGIAAQCQIVDQNKSALSSDLFSKGTLCLEAKNYRRASQFFLAAISHNPDNPDYYYGNAVAHYYLSHLDTASIYIRKAIERDAYQANYYYYAGAIYYARDWYDKAKEHFEKAISLNEHSDLKIDVDNAQFHIGVCLMKLDYHWEAIKRFNELLEIKPDYDKAILNRGIAYGMVRSYDKACQDFGRSALLGNDRAKGLMEKHCYSLSFVQN